MTESNTKPSLTVQQEWNDVTWFARLNGVLGQLEGMQMAAEYEAVDPEDFDRPIEELVELLEAVNVE